MLQLFVVNSRSPIARIPIVFRVSKGLVHFGTNIVENNIIPIKFRIKLNTAIAVNQFVSHMSI